MNWRERIRFDPSICHGKLPVVQAAGWVRRIFALANFSCGCGTNRLRTLGSETKNPRNISFAYQRSFAGA